MDNAIALPTPAAHTRWICGQTAATRRYCPQIRRPTDGVYFLKVLRKGGVPTETPAGTPPHRRCCGLAKRARPPLGWGLGAEIERHRVPTLGFR